MRHTILILIPALLVGCSTSTKDLQAVLDAQTHARPTIAMTCPAGGCTLEYTDPRDRNMKLPTNGYDAMISVSGQLTGMVGAAVVPAAMGYMAIKGFDALKGSGANTTTTTTTDNRTTDRHDVVTDRHDITDSHDQTATPTVVTQPAPVQIPAPQVVVVGP